MNHDTKIEFIQHGLHISRVTATKWSDAWVNGGIATKKTGAKQILRQCGVESRTVAAIDPTGLI